MVPAEKWTGYFEQQRRGRQPMHDLSIAFDGNKLAGAGWDFVGSFQLSGTILHGRQIEITKHYEFHQVAYLGEYDGEGTISGVWALAGDQGRFAMRQAGGFRRDVSEIPERKF